MRSGSEHIDLLERVEKRFRNEWPGTRTTGNGQIHTYPEIRPGGSTEAALDLMLRIIEEEL